MIMNFITEEDGKSMSLSSSVAHPCRLFSLPEIQSATNNFDDNLVIGEGGFGKVYKGQISSEQEDGHDGVVAIKRLDSMSSQGEVEFRAEIDMLSTLRHCHLVSLIGYCHENKEMILVYEYMPNGTLYHHLHKADTPLSWLTRLKIAVGAARGLDYLHTGVGRLHGVIHRDVKSSNILLDKNWASMISDFGLSKIGPTNQLISHIDASVKGTFGYLDPEFFYTAKLTRKTDVYAFGVVLFELLSGRLPVDGQYGEEECSLVRWAQKCVKGKKYDQMVDPNIKGTFFPNLSKQFAKIANRCVDSVPKERPTMTEIVASLQALLISHGTCNHSGKSLRIIMGFSWKLPSYFVSTSKPLPNSGRRKVLKSSKPPTNYFDSTSRIEMNQNSFSFQPPKFDDIDDIEYKLRELGTDQVFDVSSSWGVINQTTSNTAEGRTITDIVSRRDLNELLFACAKSIAESDTITANWLISELRPMVSVSGKPAHRLGAYMLEGLVARLSSSGSSIYSSVKCKEPSGDELFSYMLLLHQACPYFKFGYLSANGAIAEAMKNESKIHIIDFQIAQGSQWVTLIQALACRPGGPPSLRITCVDDFSNAYARAGEVNIVGQRLAKLAQSCNLPFEFQCVFVSGSETENKHLGVIPGESVAVNFAFMLHHMPDESVNPQNHRDRVLRLVKSLSPKVVTLVEQESNVNTAPFFNRFQETLSYYKACFESIDVTLPRNHQQRVNVEQHCLARDIVNIIACEGAERVKRHELLGKWRSRFTMAGFTPHPLSPHVNSTIKSLLENYSHKYSLVERDGALFLGWMNRDLVSVCAWK